ncbi:hypothetical protein COV94_01205, partial [Candidatus Woesearchaeota archaeon CG11_big_fil_rev_8_21_14_0_20_57_5]
MAGEVAESLAGIAAIMRDLPDRIIAKPREVKELLSEVLSADELSLLGSSYDIIGDIVLIELPPELEQKSAAIGQCYLQFHKGIRAIAAKAGMHVGEHRLQPVRVIAGEDNLTTVHHENGARLKLTLGKTYYSPRSAGERMRVASLVKPGEDVLVMFSGSGPYVLTLAKNSEAGKIVGVELNADAHALAEENAQRNKAAAGRIALHCGDANEVVPTLGQFDRIVMPLPKGAAGFFSTSLAACKDSAMIHYYFFCREKELQADCAYELTQLPTEGYDCSIVRCVACGGYSPGITRTCIDIAVKRK